MSTIYWENFDRSFDDFEKEGFNLDDLLVKSKSVFSGSKTTFSSKSKFNFGVKNSAVHEYSVKRKLQSGNLEFKHKDNGETTLEADSQILTKDKVSLNSFSKFIFTQSENKKSLIGNVMFRVHHKNNSLISFGVEDWNSLEGRPKFISAYTSYGHKADKLNLNLNTYFNFDLENKCLPLAKFLVKGEKDNFTGYLQANLTRVHEAPEEKEKPVVIVQAVDLVAKFVNVLDSKTKVGGALKYNVENKNSEAAIFASHSLDRVKLNAKVDTNRTLSFGVTSAFDDVTLNFASKSVLNVTNPADSEKRNSWVNFKFGATVEFNRL